MLRILICESRFGGMNMRFSEICVISNLVLLAFSLALEPNGYADDRASARIAAGVFQAAVSYERPDRLRFVHPSDDLLEVEVLTASSPLVVQLRRTGLIEWSYRGPDCQLDVLASSDAADGLHFEAMFVRSGPCPEWMLDGGGSLLSGSYIWIGEL